MRLGIIAEGKADIAVIKAVLKALKGIDGSDVVQLIIGVNIRREYTTLIHSTTG